MRLFALRGANSVEANQADAILDATTALMREMMRDAAVIERLNASLLEPVVETIEETKAFIAAEVPKHVALLKKAGFEAQ